MFSQYSVDVASVFSFHASPAAVITSRGYVFAYNRAAVRAPLPAALGLQAARSIELLSLANTPRQPTHSTVIWDSPRLIQRSCPLPTAQREARLLRSIGLWVIRSQLVRRLPNASVLHAGILCMPVARSQLPCRTCQPLLLPLKLLPFYPRHSCSVLRRAEVDSGGIASSKISALRLASRRCQPKPYRRYLILLHHRGLLCVAGRYVTAPQLLTLSRQLAARDARGGRRRRRRGRRRPPVACGPPRHCGCITATRST